MNVFLAGIIQGSLSREKIHAQDWREPIKRILSEHLPQSNVYCHYSKHPNSITYRMDDIRSTFADGLARARDCDLLIAYLPSASMGTAIEMHEARRCNSAIVTISPLAPNWVLRIYSDIILPDTDAFEAFAASGDLGRLVEEKHRS